MNLTLPPPRILGKPGTAFGPCDSFCNHDECKYLRIVADCACQCCGKTLGYEVQYYPYSGRTLEEIYNVAHADCVRREMQVA